MNRQGPTHALKTAVRVEKTRAEIETLLIRHGATKHGVMQDNERGFAVIAFRIGGKDYQVEIPLPERDYGSASRRGGYRNEAAVARDHEQKSRTRWRLILLAMKAKLDLVAIGVSTIDREFLADKVLPDGRPFHEAIDEALAAVHSRIKALPPAAGR